MDRLSVSAFAVLATLATPAAAAGYDPRAAFAPLDLPGPIGAQRSADGRPGPGYWQNRADYRIHATLDTTR